MQQRDTGTAVRDLASRLTDQLPTLTEELVRLIGVSMPLYLSAGTVSARDLRSSCYRNLEQALAELVSGQPGRGEGAPTPQHETGRRRAQQGLPLESLLHSYRLGGRVIWQGLVREATRRSGGADVLALLDEAVVVWELIDRHSEIAARAYREEQSRLQRRTQRRREALLAFVLDGRGITDTVIREAAEVLGMPVEGPRFVVVSAVDTARPEPSASPEPALAAAGLPTAWISQGDRDAGLVCLPEPEAATRAVALLGECLTGAAGVSPVVQRFTDLADAFRLATLTLQTLPSGFTGVARLADRLPQALLGADPLLRDAVAQETLGPVLALRPADRDVYLDTAEAFVDCDRSYAAAAERLYCHRNTVLKRIRRIEALTGLDLSRLQDLLTLRLALLALRPDGGQAATGTA